MPIQFRCPSCRQPIEIDDAFGGQAVGCPFCQKVVTAPTASEPEAAAFMPSAAAPPSTSVELGYPAAVSQPRPNWPASAGLVAAGVVVVAVGILFVLSASLASRIKGIETSEGQSELIKQLQSHPAVLPLSIVTLIADLSGLVLSIIGLRPGYQGRKWQAAIGLTICGLLIIVQCLGVVQGLSRQAVGG
ncbi:MAG: hypothetical protein L6Q92_07935 [Phycisphaerae bacterium]|nr:hypothetical protein [Phycisphaerae bacterium]